MTMKHWLTTRMGIQAQPCTWCGDPVFEDPKVRNAQDGGRHGCSITDAIQYQRLVPRPTYEEELIEEWYSSDMESELPENADEEWSIKVEVES